MAKDENKEVTAVTPINKKARDLVAEVLAGKCEIVPGLDEGSLRYDMAQSDTALAMFARFGAASVKALRSQKLTVREICTQLSMKG